MMANLLDLKMIPLMPTTASSVIKEIAFKTNPSASKVEIKRVLESFYGLEVQKVRTLNMKGKKKNHAAGTLYAKPNYKKAYVTLKKPLSDHPLFTATNTVEADKNKMLTLASIWKPLYMEAADKELSCL
ncbi:uncharacterized protein LOC133289742 [Gastrolobium bilobum]|uniref:uncharacterized protein LOC133289742 n=1 Tax=Gastrolobium bilobum TaxID=150636 RepID=UPI002AB2669C|nr:uncharacterized protein LOC133289742 [Gastrolobium bilobum]